ncbi:MAG: hypothetical protein ACK46X_05150 [Candidatus Sericytochromatia bacterium]
MLSGTGEVTARRPVGAFPHGIAFDPQGRAWVANRHSQSVSRVSVP